MSKTKILIVSATEREIQPLLSLVSAKIDNRICQIDYSENLFIDILISGVGIAAMTYSLSKYLSNNHIDFAILMGISGAYNSEIELGEVFNISVERFADIGVLNKDGFKELFDMNLLDKNSFPFEEGRLINYSLINNKTVNDLAVVKSNTVNTIRPIIIPSIKKNTDIENMEGAAFFYVCLQERLPFIQIRAISNYVGEQDKANWNIELAVNNLNNVIVSLLAELS